MQKQISQERLLSSNSANKSSSTHQFEPFYAPLRLDSSIQPRHLHPSSKIFLRINQSVTTHPQVFRRTPLAPPKSPPTFAVPNRQTDYGALGKHPEKNLERSGTPAVESVSIICAGSQAAKKYFSNYLQSRKKPSYLCSPLQPEASKFEKPKRKN
jgi:hypothetical protein